jgi:hypothetical protein
MRNIPGVLFYLLLTVTEPSILVAQTPEGVFDDRGVAREMVLDERIKTIQLYREGWINSYPVMLLNDAVPLVLEFDELINAESDFTYYIYHCDADWSRSALYEQEYMEGLFGQRIMDAEPSFNTYFSYYHYTLKLPNDEVSLTRSGNYILAVYRYDELVFTRRFLVSEAAVSILARAGRPVLSAYRENSHEVDITVEHPGYRIDDPYRETTLSVYQNGIWDYEITGLQPLFVNPGELVYDYQEENIFPAGNEFRMFNTRSTQVREYHIERIGYLDYFHFHLKPDAANPAHLYFDRDDMNGRSYIEAARTRDPAVEADYVYVHFTLQMPLPLYNGDVYIAGECTNWQFTEMNRMEYDDESQAYLGTLLLKQGIHNYRYIFLPDNRNTFDISEIEGSHYQTKNEYLILFYHRPQGERYDRLIGHQVIHSTAG